MKKKVLSKDPWPELGIEHYQSIEDGRWGYLIAYDDGSFEFDMRQVPGCEAILKRWAYYLNGDAVSDTRSGTTGHKPPDSR